MEQHVDASEFLLRARDQLGHVRGSSDVAADVDGRAAAGHDLIADFPRACRVPVRYGNSCAVGRQQ